jgi:hypothetical protein
VLSRPLGFTHSKPSNHNNGLLQFRNDSGFLPTRVGKPGVFALYMDARHPKSACTERGLLISVRSGVNARAVAAAHQSSRSARRRVPIGTRPVRPVHCTELCIALNLITLSSTGHRRIGLLSNDRRCTNSHAASVPPAAARPAHERPLRPPKPPQTQTPEEGRPGRNDSRCAGITK